MSGTKNTWGLVVDYNLLAGKGRALTNKQNGSCKEDLKSEMLIDDKNASASKCKSINKGENKTGSSFEHDRNVFNKFMADQNSSKSEEFKMVALECNKCDEEIILTRRVRKQIIINVKDDRTGSMMPVVLEEMVDGTMSKKTGRKSVTNLAWLGMEIIFLTCLWIVEALLMNQLFQVLKKLEP